MASATVLGVNGSPSAESRTGILLRAVLDRVSVAAGRRTRLLHLVEDVPSLLQTRSRGGADKAAEAAIRAAETAEMLVVGSPVYRGSYTGLFKHFFDLVEWRSLAGMPVLMVATGGSDRHALALEHQFRPLFGFFGSLTIPTAIYATEAEIVDGQIVSEALQARIGQGAAQAAGLLRRETAQAA